MLLPTLVTKGCLLSCSAICVVWVVQALAGEVSGQVVDVLDGNTIEVLHNVYCQKP